AAVATQLLTARQGLAARVELLGLELLTGQRVVVEQRFDDGLARLGLTGRRLARRSASVLLLAGVARCVRSSIVACVERATVSAIWRHGPCVRELGAEPVVRARGRLDAQLDVQVIVVRVHAGVQAPLVALSARGAPAPLVPD